MIFPKLKLEKVPVLAGWDAVKISIYSIVIAFVFFSVFLLSQGTNPIDAYGHMFSYAFDPDLGLSATIHRSMILLFATLAFILPIKAGVWNVGMEGQLYLGTIGAFAVAYAWGDFPSWALIPLMLITAAFFGAIYGALMGFLKGKYGVNEIVMALMLNWIGFWLIYLLVVGGPWAGVAESESRFLPHPARAPMILENVVRGGVPFTVLLAPVLAVILYLLFKRSSIGFQIRALGGSQPAAEHAGINPVKITLFVMIAGGAIAGLSAYHTWAGDTAWHRIPRPDTYKAVGDLTYWGIMVGLLCIGNPLAAIPTSIFVGALREGGTVLNRRLELPFGLDLVFLGILFVAFVALQFFYRYKLRMVKRGS